MKSIYLDYNSTTPVASEVLEAMMPYFSEKFGNASSHTHAYGWTAAAAVEKAREQVATLIGAEPSEIIFTSGATEALNLALRGAMEAYSQKGRHLIVCASEHKAVLDTAKDLQFKGVETSVLGVDREGRIDPEELEKMIREDTVLVAVMMANNETGVLQDSETIGNICRQKKVIHLCDTTQALGKIKVNTTDAKLDMCTLSAHKIYGPKGIGALYVRRKEPRVKLLAEITGGGHERGLRAGTLNVPGIVGLGAACEGVASEWWDFGASVSHLRTLLEQQLTVEKSFGFINGSTRHRLPNTTNICFKGRRSERLIKSLPELSMSMGAACSSALPEPSHVLRAMGLSEEDIYSSIRFSLGKQSTEEEVKTAILRISAALEIIE